MKIVVINLATSPERREASRIEMEKHGLEFEFVEGWTGQRAVEEGLVKVNHDRYAVRTGAKITDGKIGCLASHLVVWKMAIEIQEPILILEDDFVLTDQFHEALSNADRWITRYGMIRFYSSGHKGTLIDSKGSIELRRFTKAPYTGLGYAVSPEAAAKLVNNFGEFIEPHDFYIKRYWLHKQPDYQIYPDVMHHNAHADTTTIEVGLQIKRTPILRIRRLWDQICNSSGRKLYNFIFAVNNLLRPNNKI